jgi:hypothetical protein
MTQRIAVHWSGDAVAKELRRMGAAITDDVAEVTCSVCLEQINPPPAAIYVGPDDWGVEQMVTVWPDGTAEIATRDPYGSGAWSPPYRMERREVDSDGTLTENASPTEQADQAEGSAARSGQGGVRPD